MPLRQRDRAFHFCHLAYLEPFLANRFARQRLYQASARPVGPGILDLTPGNPRTYPLFENDLLRLQMSVKASGEAARIQELCVD